SSGKPRAERLTRAAAGRVSRDDHLTNGERVQREHQPAVRRGPCCLDSLQRMEPLWSQAVAISGNRSQMRQRQKRLKQAKTLAVGCHRLPPGAHGKEGVDGSSPSEGFR